MQRTWSIVDDRTGAIKVTVTADTNNGILLEFTPVTWMTPQEAIVVASTVASANQWYSDNGGV